MIFSKKIISAVALLCVAASCKKSTCKDSDITTFPLNQAKVSTLPYIKGTDTLRFTDEQSRALSLIAVSKRTYYNEGSKSTTPCEGISEKREGTEIAFADSVNKVSFYYNYYVAPYDSNEVQVAVYYDNTNFVIDYKSLKAPYVRDMQINGNTYKDVYACRLNTDTLYFSLPDGVIRIRKGNKILQK